MRALACDTHAWWVGRRIRGRAPARRAPAAALAHLERTNRPCRPPQKAHLFLSWMCSDAPALMSASTDGRWPWCTAQCSAVLPSLCRQGWGGVGWPRGYPDQRTGAIPYRLQPRAYLDGWKTGLRANGDEKKSNLWTSWHGNAPVLDVEVLPALTQQFLHATQLLDHKERRHGVSS
jgi:hypothetical protein